MSALTPAPEAPAPQGRFPLPIALFCCLWLAVIVGVAVRYVVADQFLGVALTYEYGDPNKPWWLERDVIMFISTAVGVAVAVPSFVWTVVALRRPRERPIRAGWIAVAGVALVGIPVGVLAMIAVQELTPESWEARFGVGPAVGLIVGSVVAFGFNTRALRRYPPIN